MLVFENKRLITNRINFVCVNSNLIKTPHNRRFVCKH